MEVEVKAEKFDETQSNTYQGQSLPAKKIREAKSVVTVRDGEIIVLGGLQEVQVDSTESKYNLLSDIPYLGKKFFRPKTVKYTPTELLIFLKPTIMRPGFNDTEDNINSIDERIKGDYKPKFTSPSGQILGMPDIDGKNKGQASQGQAFLPTQFVMNSLFAKTIRGRLGRLFSDLWSVPFRWPRNQALSPYPGGHLRPKPTTPTARRKSSHKPRSFLLPTNCVVATISMGNGILLFIISRRGESLAFFG